MRTQLPNTNYMGQTQNQFSGNPIIWNPAQNQQCYLSFVEFVQDMEDSFTISKFKKIFAHRLLMLNDCSRSEICLKICCSMQ